MNDFLKKLWRLAHPYRWRLWLGVFSGILSGLAEPFLMFSVALVFSVVFPGQQDAVLNKYLSRLPGWFSGMIDQASNWVSVSRPGGSEIAVGLVIALVPLAMLVKSTFTYLNAYLMNWVAIRAVSDLRVRLFEHLLHLPLSFFNKTSTGELMSRTSDVGVLQNILTNALTVVIQQPVKVVSYLAVLFTLQPKLTLFSLAVFPVCIIPIAIYSRKVRKSSAEIQSNYAQLARSMHEAFTGMRIIKAYNLEDRVVDQYRAGITRFISHFMRVIRSTEIPGPLIEFFGALGVAGILFFIAHGTPITAADFLLFVGSIFGMYQPIKSLVRLHSQMEQARASTERVFQLLATESTLPEPASPRPLRAEQADIRFENLEFGYDDRVTLRDINLTVKHGHLVALVGSSGSGKTTLTNLLLRFYDPSKGRILVGETDIREVSTRDLRNHIAVVTQETVLFNDTVWRNIELGRPGATHAEIEAAARHAHAHQFIADKPGGYETVIGEKGVMLSGGQRQRIAIARALLRNAPILILDEATNALDTESEREVQAQFDELMEGRTTICIAHRLSTIQNADQIVVMDHGRIVEIGTHDELLARNGIYKKLYDLQFAGV